MAENKSRNWFPLSLTMFGGAVIVLALIAWISIHYFISKPKPQKEFVWLQTINDQMRSNDPAVRNLAEKGLIERAMFIRENWSSWAMSHQDILREMYSGSTPNEAAVGRYVRVFALSFSPNTPSCIPPKILNSATGVFSWNCAPLSNNYWDQGSPAYSTIPAREIRTEVLGNYAKFHDIIISDSCTTVSGEKVSLWASGRITKGPVRVVRPKYLGDIAYSAYTPTEIAPSFAFLSALPKAGAGTTGV